ncbi:MAG: 4-hydroxy-tetrahydrodipicolinate synthase [Rhodospirillaceae bacterium]|jgi:4-hydroxy-tetrahydrodipicolinate synthase|nr:4-hydroxy-tetrahydrodipicolinate synthase [Rhodospirillaceae bacterium]MBT3628289.1 4-hydroxy-tetrahydrodipicolinate synthase [Rhodospirillaceae bacterium]MBT3928734.1 4-hydroxy-tetrahydrodipicolinate synthase [Rhodospirillaceae bacterium]MBT4427385.1 4-hydroxy-tetrahydrodipicolinate synthase [Rhodospirillaceae bacterium]MBT5038101.1 4-hydroxy-tetrahydrodipicolinate synthase [Rhodospirillaceae bacterium]
MLEGYFTALITPMRDGVVDEEAFRAFVEWQIAEGVAGLVPCGTTGESPTLSHAEHRRVTEICVQVANGRVPVIAGTGSNSTAEAIELTQHAKSAGADAALLVMPYYNKPTQEGMYQHFKAVQDAVALPQIIYNIPGRSVVNMSVETMARLAKLPNIAGVKDATADLTRPTLTRNAIGAEFTQLSGEDGTAIGFYAQGGHGCISVTSNVAPRACSEFFAAWKAGNSAKALELHAELMPLHDVLFCESSPIPVKYAAYLLGKCGPEMRLPLCAPADASKKRIEAVLAALGMLKEAAA